MQDQRNPGIGDESLRVLFVEDNPIDVELMVAMLKRVGYRVEHSVVDRLETLQQKLERPEFDIILSDYNLRSWTGTDALEAVRASGKDIPFILVTGTLGDEAAVDCIKRGAADYVLKHKLERLPVAVRRALEEKAWRDERARTDAELKKSEALYRLLFDSNPHPMWVYDLETLSFLAANDAAVHYYGYSRQEFLGMTIKDIRPEEDVPRLLKETDEPFELFSPSAVWKHRKKDGTLIDAEISAHALTYQGRRARLVMANDVTERKQLELQLQQSQKMEAVGRLAGGIAHDFNNLLTVITGFSQLLLNQFKEGDPRREQADEIKKAGDRAASLTRQLLAFSRLQVLQPQVLDVNQVVSNMERMLQRLIGEDVELATALDQRTGRVKADPGQIEQVIMNLVVNARDATASGGKITIETRNVELDESYARAHYPVNPGPHVMLAVTDNGTGMDAETQKHIFEPFFTTKEKGKGTGLGLATVYGIVKQSGGFVWVYSELGKGTSFKIYFPCLDGSSAARKEARVSEKAARGSETILLVEDEAALRNLISEVLRGKGYRVLEASHGGEALSVCRNHEGPIHLVLTDVVMPRMSGRELAEKIQALRPKTKVLYMSGYTDSAIVNHGVLEQGVAFIQKPFAPEALAVKVRDTLGQFSNV